MYEPNQRSNEKGVSEIMHSFKLNDGGWQSKFKDKISSWFDSNNLILKLWIIWSDNQMHASYNNSWTCIFLLLFSIKLLEERQRNLMIICIRPPQTTPFQLSLLCWILPSLHIHIMSLFNWGLQTWFLLDPRLQLFLCILKNMKSEWQRTSCSHNFTLYVA